MSKIRLPGISIALMIVYAVGGCLAIVIRWPPGPGRIDWGVWIVGYLSYFYIIAAALFYVYKNK